MNSCYKSWWESKCPLASHIQTSTHKLILESWNAQWGLSLRLKLKASLPSPSFPSVFLPSLLLFLRKNTLFIKQIYA